LKLVAFKYNKDSIVSCGFIKEGAIIDIGNHSNPVNIDVQSGKLIDIENIKFKKISIDEVSLLSPILNPKSLRDAYAFRQHVEAGRKSRGLDMIPEYDRFPVFYYGNHNAIAGPGEVQIQKDQSIKLDYELEVAAIIGEKGKNISVDNADDYIMGYTIMNDLSARALQKEEMKLSLGPAKGKDFLTTLGPYIITKDELEDKCIKGSDGNRYDLNMRAYLNGKLLSQDNFKNITWTFAQIISRISNGTEIYPGDVIGSGTCATGCLLELNQTNNTDIWLQDGDEIKLEIDKMGSLINTIKFI
jgi:fumarylacetoacetate (FAA) hydrolase